MIEDFPVLPHVKIEVLQAEKARIAGEINGLIARMKIIDIALDQRSTPALVLEIDPEQGICE